MTVSVDPSILVALNVIAGRMILGGCDDCGGYQKIERQGENSYTLGTFHETDCPRMFASVTRGLDL